MYRTDQNIQYDNNLNNQFNHHKKIKSSIIKNYK